MVSSSFKQFCNANQVIPLYNAPVSKCTMPSFSAIIFEIELFPVDENPSIAITGFFHGTNFKKNSENSKESNIKMNVRN